jgi:hypothetical protein
VVREEVSSNWKVARDGWKRLRGGRRMIWMLGELFFPLSSLTSNLCFATTCWRDVSRAPGFAATHPYPVLNSEYCLVCRSLTLLLTRFSQSWSQSHYSKGDVEEMRHHCCNCLNPPRRSILHVCCMLLALALKRVICIGKGRSRPVKQRAFWVLDKSHF